jgi:hypothetical protein
MSREMLDAEGGASLPPTGPPTSPPTLDLDLAAGPDTPAPAADRTARQPSQPAAPQSGPQSPRLAERKPPERAQPTDRTGPAAGATAHPVPPPGDGFAADLDDQPPAAADRPTRWQAVRLTGRDGRRLTLLAAAVAVAVLAAVGGYTQAQKAQTRRALDSARLVLWVDDTFFNTSGLASDTVTDPIPVQVHLSVTASVDLTVTRLQLPGGEAVPTSRVLVHPGQATIGDFLIRNACPADWRTLPQTTTATALARTPDGRQRTLPLDLGSTAQFFDRDFICNRTGADPNGQNLVVEGMTAQRGGIVALSLHSEADTDLLVTAAASTLGSAGWTIRPDPTKPVLIHPGQVGELKVRLIFANCTTDGSIVSASGLLALRVGRVGDPAGLQLVDPTQLGGWDDAAVVLAGGDAANRACGPQH